MLQTDHTAAVPEFGDWDEPDPTPADRYTYIFNQVREERLKGTGNVAAAATPGKAHYKDLKKHKNGAFKVSLIFLLMVSISLHEMVTESLEMLPNESFISNCIFVC